MRPYSSVTKPVAAPRRDHNMSFIQTLGPNVILVFFGVLLLSTAAAVIALLADY